MRKNEKAPRKWQRRRTYKRFDPILEGKVFYFTGTLPGVGKSHFKKWYCEQLKRDGYRVIVTGTTHKAVEDGNTVAKQSMKVVEVKKDKYEFVMNSEKPHAQTHAFYVIDEVGMMSQEELDKLMSWYPKCCFLVFGDPLQFDPVDGGKPITKADYVFEFNAPHRFVDWQLLEFIKSVKAGNPDLKFIKNHERDCPNNSLVFCYTNDFKASVNDLYNYNIGDFVLSHKRTKIDGNLITSSLPIRNNEIWRIIEKNDDLWTLISHSSGNMLHMSYQRDFPFFELAKCVNLHKIQGDTLDCPIHFYPDQEYWKYIQKSLYVAVSRVKNSGKITFQPGLAEGLKGQKFKELKSPIVPNWIGDNNELIGSVLAPSVVPGTGTPTGADVDLIESDTLSDSTLILIRSIKVTPGSVSLPGKGCSLEHCSSSGSGLLSSTNETNNKKCKSGSIRWLASKIGLDKMKISRLLNSNRTNFDFQIFTSGKTGPILGETYDVITDDFKTNYTFSKFKGTPSIANFVSTNAITFDVDNETTNTMPEDVWRALGYPAMVAHHSLQSGKPKYKKVNGTLTSEVIDERSVPRFHIAIAVEEISNVEVYRETWEHYASVLSKAGIIVDQVKDVARRYFGCDTEVVKKPGIVLQTVSIAKPAPVPVIHEPVVSGPIDEVAFYFEMCRYDHDNKNGGRGKEILRKARIQVEKRGWTREMAHRFIDLLCDEWKCPEKKNHLKSYF